MDCSKTLAPSTEVGVHSPLPSNDCTSSRLLRSFNCVDEDLDAFFLALNICVVCICILLFSGQHRVLLLFDCNREYLCLVLNLHRRIFDKLFNMIPISVSLTTQASFNTALCYKPLHKVHKSNNQTRKET